MMRLRDDLILIASSDVNGGIGKDNQLLLRIPEDMRHFREQTLGQTVIVGRKTLMSFKDGKPLPGRNTIVLSSQPGYAVEGASVANNLHALFDMLDGVREKLYVIGGESVYRLLVGFCNRALITRFDQAWEADAYLPDISSNTGWICVSEGEWVKSEKGIRYRIQEYERHPDSQRITNE